MGFWISRMLWRYTLRTMQRKPLRTLLTLTSVVIGVAGAVAITATTRATHRAYHVLFEAIGGRAALEVVAEGQGGIDARLVDQLATTPGVQSAVGVVCTPATL